LKQLPAEPDKSAANATLLVIRLPNGERIERRFVADVDTIQTVRDFIDTRAVVDPAKYESVLAKSGEYKLVADFPRREFSASDGALTLASAGLTKRALLVVHML
jgi:hypothetical protein